MFIQKNKDQKKVQALRHKLVEAIIKNLSNHLLLKLIFSDKATLEFNTYFNFIPYTKLYFLY